MTAIDANRSTLDVAAAKREWPETVSFVVADAFDLDAVEGDFDAAFVGFFWSHIPLDRLGRFVDGLARRLGPGAMVIVVDNRFVAGSAPVDPSHPKPLVGPTWHWCPATCDLLNPWAGAAQASISKSSTRAPICGPPRGGSTVTYCAPMCCPRWAAYPSLLSPPPKSARGTRRSGRSWRSSHK